jgi:pimeloyl-ACP methyl ester carboxylesterase
VSESPLPRPPLLFVHGAWHSAWCWDEYFLPWFRARGWDCSAVALRGHGDGAHAGELRWQPAKRTLDDVVAAVEAANRPPVLVGHSLGGYLALRALEEYHLPAAALLAPVPVMGPLPAFMRGLRAEPRAFLGAALALDAGRIVGSPELARRFLYSPAVPEVTVRRTSDRLGAESLRAILDTLLRLPNVAAIRARHAAAAAGWRCRRPVHARRAAPERTGVGRAVPAGGLWHAQSDARSAVGTHGRHYRELAAG